MRSFFLIFVCSIISFQSRSQILPKEGSSLNYRLIGFSYSAVGKASGYTLEIARGNYTIDDSFKKNIIKSISDKKNKIIAEVPSFGVQYTWRMICSSASAVTKGELHHFSTANTAEVDTHFVRLRILHGDMKYKDGYVFLDGNRAIYDMEGNPVWFLPNSDRFNGPQYTLVPVIGNDGRQTNKLFIPAYDMKLTSQGTITFIFYETAYEINYNGDILWTAPAYDKVDKSRDPYHHEFTRLTNGRYLALKNGYEDVYATWVHNSAADSSLSIVQAGEVKKDDKNVFNRKTEFANIKEYDSEGHVVWSWRSSKYFVDQDKGKDLAYCWRTNDPDHQEVHANSMFFNEKDSIIYIGFRNISRVIKLQYPSGKILSVYGDDHSTESAGSAKKLFCYQHSCRRSKKGYLYLFNNNLCNQGQMPEVEILKEPISGKGNLNIVWQYVCAESEEKGKKTMEQFTQGGNVIELADGSMFVNMGSDYSKLFIVGHNKKEFWSALPERWDATKNEWTNILQYRASIVLSRKEIESLIWGESIK